MRARYIGESDPLECINGRDYEITGDHDDCYGVVDEVGACYGFSYLYNKESFIVTENTPFRTGLSRITEKVQKFAEKNGFANVRYVRQWGDRDIFEFFTKEETEDVIGTRMHPVLFACKGDEIQRLSEKELSAFMQRFDYYFIEDYEI